MADASQFSLPSMTRIDDQVSFRVVVVSRNSFHTISRVLQTKIHASAVDTDANNRARLVRCCSDDLAPRFAHEHVGDASVFTRSTLDAFIYEVCIYPACMRIRERMTYSYVA